MPPGMLLRRVGLSRTTSDTARVAGALAGAGGVALIGMGPAYVVVTAMYVAAFLLSLGVGESAALHHRPLIPLSDLKDAFSYVWQKPDLLGAFTHGLPRQPARLPVRAGPPALRREGGVRDRPGRARLARGRVLVRRAGRLAHRRR